MVFELITNNIKPTILPSKDEIEEWRIVEACPKYEVSSFGRVRHITRQHILTPTIDKSGYPRVCFYDNKEKKQKKYKVHRLVALAFCDGYISGEKEIVDHIDHCPQNNYYKNLRFVSRSENVINRCKAIRNPRINLTEWPVVLFDKNTNEPKALYPSVTEACEELSLSISNVLENIYRRRMPYKIGYFVLLQDLPPEELEKVKNF